MEELSRIFRKTQESIWCFFFYCELIILFNGLLSIISLSLPACHGARQVHCVFLQEHTFCAREEILVFLANSINPPAQKVSCGLSFQAELEETEDHPLPLRDRSRLPNWRVLA